MTYLLIVVPFVMATAVVTLATVRRPAFGRRMAASAVAVLGTSVFDAIQEAARAPDIGMVALATHGRGGVRRLVLGSVADKLVRGGELPVLVTRPGGR